MSHNSYTKISVKCAINMSLVVLFTSVDKHICHFNVILCIEFNLPDAGLSTTKQDGVK
jgi:hypothetical protein